MDIQIKHLKGGEIPQAWRPTWTECWVVELGGAVVGGPYNSRGEAERVARGEQPPRLLHTPAP